MKKLKTNTVSGMCAIMIRKNELRTQLLFKIMVFYFVLIFMHGCNYTDDPYNPFIGPRNPIPDAQKYLEANNEIQEFEKKDFLLYRPVSIGLLTKLSKVQSREVRALVACNPSATTVILEDLSNDEDPGVRQCVALNNGTPRNILLKLMKDLDANVRWVLPSNKNFTADDIRLMYREGNAPAVMIACNPSTPIDLLVELSNDKDTRILDDLAANESINNEIALTISKSGSVIAKRSLAINPATPDVVLMLLSNDADADVRLFSKQTLQARQIKARIIDQGVQ